MESRNFLDDGSKTSLLLSIRGVEEKKNYLHREEKERKHVDTDNTSVRERTRREEERKYFEVQSFVSYGLGTSIKPPIIKIIQEKKSRLY